MNGVWLIWGDRRDIVHLKIYSEPLATAVDCEIFACGFLGLWDDLLRLSMYDPLLIALLGFGYVQRWRVKHRGRLSLSKVHVVALFR